MAERAELALSLDPAEARAQLKQLKAALEDAGKATERSSPLFEGFRSKVAESQTSGVLRSGNNVLDMASTISTVIGTLGAGLQTANGFVGQFGRAINEASATLKTAISAPAIAQSGAGAAAGMLAPFAAAGMRIDPRLEQQILDVQLQRTMRVSELQNRLENAATIRMGAIYAHRIGNAVSMMAGSLGG